MMFDQAEFEKITPQCRGKVRYEKVMESTSDEASERRVRQQPVVLEGRLEGKICEAAGQVRPGTPLDEVS